MQVGKARLGARGISREVTEVVATALVAVDLRDGHRGEVACLERCVKPLPRRVRGLAVSGWARAGAVASTGRLDCRSRARTTAIDHGATRVEVRPVGDHRLDRAEDLCTGRGQGTVPARALWKVGAGHGSVEPMHIVSADAAWIPFHARAVPVGREGRGWAGRRIGPIVPPLPVRLPLAAPPAPAGLRLFGYDILKRHKQEEYSLLIANPGAKWRSGLGATGLSQGAWGCCRLLGASE